MSAFNTVPYKSYALQNVRARGNAWFAKLDAIVERALHIRSTEIWINSNVQILL